MHAFSSFPSLTKGKKKQPFSNEFRQASLKENSATALDSPSRGGFSALSSAPCRSRQEGAQATLAFQLVKRGIRARPASHSHHNTELCTSCNAPSLHICEHLAINVVYFEGALLLNYK